MAEHENATRLSGPISSTDILVDRTEGGQAVEMWIYFENEKLLDGITL